MEDKKTNGFLQRRNPALIEVQNLTKWYGTNLAVDHVSFTIESGHVYGFLGPNGAGKSTTMNMITGCLAASEGRVTVGGYDIFEEPIAAKRLIGYLPEIPPLYTDMTPREFLTFVGGAKHIPKAELPAKIEAVMEKTQITHVADRLIGNLSKGYRQRVCIAEAILGDPAVVILDEPTVGLDPLQIIEIRDLIRSLGHDHTVILSSHILQEISAVCDRVIMISRGRIVANDSLSNLTGEGGGHSLLRIESRGSVADIEAALRALPDVVRVSASSACETVRTEIETAPGTDRRDDIFRVFARLDAPILSMSSGATSLEEMFLKLADEASAAEYGTDREAPAASGDRADSAASGVAEPETAADGAAYTPLFTTEKEEDK